MHLIFPKDLQGLLAVIGLQDMVALLLQVYLYGVYNFLIVVAY